MEFFVELTIFTAAGLVPTIFIWVPLYYLSRKIKPDIEYTKITNTGLIVLLVLGILTIAAEPGLFILFILMAVSMIIWSVVWYYLKEQRESEEEFEDGEYLQEQRESKAGGFEANDYLLLSRSLMTVAFLMILGMNYYCLAVNSSGHADFRMTNVAFLFAVVGVMELLLVLKVSFNKLEVSKRTSVLTLAFCLFGVLDLLLLIKLGIAPMYYVDWIRMHQ
ncbi:MAG: hypothetical protein HPY50_07590 [Firmicutes bacterium]|nr:hypothetical protein [Bacillota bacterium]